MPGLGRRGMADGSKKKLGDCDPGGAARRDFEKTFELDPSGLEPLLNLGVFFETGRDVRMAIPACDPNILGVPLPYSACCCFTNSGSIFSASAMACLASTACPSFCSARARP
jgi:hypothetical protein